MTLVRLLHSLIAYVIRSKVQDLAIIVSRSTSDLKVFANSCGNAHQLLPKN